VGITAAGLPVGLQIVGRRFAERTVLAASAVFEAAQPWAARRPPVG
jgi:aspartyl-tRNA(Asn)/glutamyl-tRNA(Gln) amidotransferase subunit A